MPQSSSPSSPSPSSSTEAAAPPARHVIKRDGRRAPFDPQRIRRALQAAFRAERGVSGDEPLPKAAAAQVDVLATEVVAWCRQQDLTGEGDRLHVEAIQDEVERALMRAGEHAVARRYILYREAHAQERAARTLRMRRPDGETVALPRDALQARVEVAAEGLDEVDPAAVYDRAAQGFYDGITAEETHRALVLAARSMVETEPAYTYVAARLLLQSVYAEALGRPVALDEAPAAYRAYLADYIQTGIDAGRLDPGLQTFDLERLAAALRPERDFQHTYLSAQTLYDRYLLRAKDGRRYELPQLLWMRVAMGLALEEDDRERRAIQFYELLSSLRFVNSTPTLFNAGTVRPQLSSCYLTTVQDDLSHIFKSYRDNALLSKWAGGLGNDWTNVRALGAHIRGTGGKSQGVVPFLKIANDTAVAVNQGGKRKGAACAYLEPWHLDIEEFLELRRNTGDERRRTHDMNTACWVPDLFMQRVADGGAWTLFSPNEVPNLHDLSGQAFRARYEEYEAQAARDELDTHKTVEAAALWRKMLSMLFETGHPWITFKDPSNVRSPQDHAGVVHSSNLCTEILLNTSEDEVAVCNLGSVNLPAHLTQEGGAEGALDHAKLKQTVTTAMRMLDNVIDLNFYPIPEAEQSNKRHRPVGLGVMGFQDALHAQELSYASDAAADFADASMEAISYYALRASALLAKERGAYPSYEGSKWDRGLLPIDTLDLLEKERGAPIEVDRTARMDWQPVRDLIAEGGLRNSNTMAIAPTATISNIAGVSQSIEPAYKHLYAKSNLSGDFTQVNTYLVEALKARGLWDAELVDDLKYYDGSLAEIERVPEDLKARFPTAFEIAPEHLIACAARRQKWIDMGQSLNLYVARPDGRRISAMYQRAWRAGLKTTYYLRSRAATQVEKSTLDVNRRGLQPRWMKAKSASGDIHVERPDPDAQRLSPSTSSPVSSDLPACDLDDDSCEACQ